ncbi:hypothetical protein [Maricaulis sp.]|uniref:hypothetical protein n=1 Tax=Maricaulis sp. TaxID=1486257 RepID=UPI003A8DBFA2
MVNLVCSVVTWGLLGIFAGFLAYGTVVATFTLFRFYQGQFAKITGNRASTPLK